MSRQENPKKLRADLEREGQLAGLRQQLLEQKTLDMLITQAKITDERLIVTPAEAAAEGGTKKKKK